MGTVSISMVFSIETSYSACIIADSAANQNKKDKKATSTLTGIATPLNVAVGCTVLTAATHCLIITHPH